MKHQIPPVIVSSYPRSFRWEVSDSDIPPATLVRSPKALDGQCLYPCKIAYYSGRRPPSPKTLEGGTVVM
jgi:hypothetical protein